MQLTHIATRDGQLSSFLQGELRMSAGLINRLKWQQKLLVNGQPQFTNFPVSCGDVITVSLEEAAPDYPAEDGNLAILYEDDFLLAVDKPAGMLIHPSHSQYTGTLANFMAGYFRRTNQSCAFHPITRLDRDTFGIVLLAKNAHAHGAMQHTEFQKTYHALVHGCPPQRQGIIDAPIARKPLPSLLRYVHPSGKPSQTEYTVLQFYNGICKLALTPITGRTHQLRVHCAHMGFPIVGDPQYGSSTDNGKGQQLCAKRLEFIHPITAMPLVLESQMDVQISPPPY